MTLISECFHGSEYCGLAALRERRSAMNASDISSAAFLGSGVLTVADAEMNLWGHTSEARPVPTMATYREPGTAGAQSVLLGTC